MSSRPLAPDEIEDKSTQTIESPNGLQILPDLTGEAVIKTIRKYRGCND